MKKVFPNAKFVAMSRASKDVVSSLKNRSGSFDGGVQRWISDNKALLENINKDFVYLVRYEDLVTQKEDTMKKVFSFLELGYSNEIFSFYKKGYEWFGVKGAKETDGKGEEKHLQRRSWQMTQPIHDRRGIWRKSLTDKEANIVDIKTQRIMSELGYLVVKVYGDSHCQGLFRNFQGCELSFKEMVFHGGTILGLGRRESTLRSSDKIKGDIGEGDIVLISLGQVDVELGFYYRKVVKDEEVEFNSFSSMLVDFYISFLSDIKGMCKGVVVKGINIPVLTDEDNAANYISRIITENVSDKGLRCFYYEKLKKTIRSYQERVNDHFNFNNKLKAAARSAGLVYMDINDVLYDENERSIARKYMPNEFDHHVVYDDELQCLASNRLLNICKKINEKNLDLI